LLNATPNGVIRNSDVAKGVVETSLNVGVVTMQDDNVEIICLIRSLIDSGKDYVVSMLESLGKLAGAKTAPKGGYPGWQPDANSPVMHLVRETYQRLFNKTPNIQIIHAGLECGLFKNRTRTWTWFLLGQPSPVRTLRMSRYISKAWAITGRC
jgi:dipeptidase D